MEDKITLSLDISSPDSLTGMNKLGVFILFLLAGLSVIFPRFFLEIESTTILGFLIYIALAVTYLVLALYLRKRESTSKFWRVAFAFSIFTIATPLANELGRALGKLILPPSNVMSVLTFYQFLTTSLPAAAIILLTLFSRDDLGSLYLKRGYLKSGLIIGIGAFLAISVFSFSPLGINAITHDPTLTFVDILPWIPWIWISVLCNGFREEIWFRGLFLKKFDAVLGKRLGNILQAVFFALPHFGVAYATRFYGNLGVILATFFVGLTMGYLTRKTDSLLAPWLVHAGLDVITWLIIFSTL